MASIRYRVLDLPAKGAGAFCPIPPMNPIASSWGLCQYTGSPGTTGVHVTAPTRIWAPPISAIAETQPSNCSPDIIFPDQYIVHSTNEVGHTLPNRISNDLPVPAVSWINTAMVAMGVRKTGGRAAMRWPRSFQRFPATSTANG